MPGAAGGVAIVLETLITSPLADRYELQLVVTHRDSGRWAKMLQAFRGLLEASWLLARRRVDLMYILTSSGSSLRRKAIMAAIARLFRRPYVVHVHASNFDRYYQDARGWEQSVIRKTLSHAALVSPCLLPGNAV